jgi:signal transduction histidine kinase
MADTAEIRTRAVLNTLSGRFLILTTVFVMLAEVMIFVPSVARFRQDFLQMRLERGQIASLALLADDMLEMDLEEELLKNAGVFNVVLRRNEVRQLALSSPIPEPIYATYDLRDPGALVLIRDALADLVNPDNRVIRVIGDPVREAGLQIEITMETDPLRKAMIEYGVNVLLLSLVISVITAALLFVAVQRLMVRPIKRVVTAMTSYTEAPEDARRIFVPDATVSELREAENALQAMQQQLTSSLRHKERLAQLGEAVAKVSHDLRNILTTTQLIADRMEMSADPGVQRAAPKLVNSISRAVNLCESTLAFGQAAEPPPRLSRVVLADLVSDVMEGERLAAGEYELSLGEDVPATLLIRADGEQMYRVLSNLVRNARQAIMATARPGEIQIHADESDTCWNISVTDTGPGLPIKAQDHLFQAFQGNVRKGGIGLGLAIASELVTGHGGSLELIRSDEGGTSFLIRLPKNIGEQNEEK